MRPVSAGGEGGVRAASVLVASTRAAEGVYPDRAGPIIVEWLRDRGYAVGAPVVVPDGDAVGAALRTALAGTVADGPFADGAVGGPVDDAGNPAGVPEVVLTSGGTGIAPTDTTPEQTAPLIERPVPGLADAIRRAGLPAVPTAVLSRGLAGVSGSSLVVNLPGSTGGVRDGLAVLADVLEHAVEQLRGGDHR